MIQSNPKVEIIQQLKSGVPPELLKRDQWVLWRIEPDSKGKLTKVPYTVNGWRADNTDPSTWSPYDICVDAFNAGGYDGMGYVFSENDPYTGIDLDKCVTDGVVSAEAHQWLQELDSYSEFSQSGTGVHIIIKAKKPGELCKNATLGVEIYDHGRGFWITGNRISKTPKQIFERQTQLDSFYAEVFAHKLKLKTQPATNGNVSHSNASTPLPDDDQWLINKLLNHPTKGGRASRLWAGDLSVKGDDHSACDQAWMNELAWLTGKDAARMDRIHRQSGLMRPKWDEYRGAMTYGQMTIEKAIGDTRNVYDPSYDLAQEAKEAAANYARAQQHASTPYTNGHGPTVAQSNIPIEYTGPAIWANKDADQPVVITGALPALNGVAWYSIEGSQTGIPGNELRLVEAESVIQPLGSPALPVIQTNNRQLKKVLSEAQEALKRRNSLTPTAPVAYSRGGLLSRVLSSSKIVQPITQSALTGIFADVADWVSVKAVKKPEPKVITSNVYPPREVVSTFLGLGEWPALPELVGVVSAPAYVGNGHWVQSPGFDMTSGLYLVDNVEIGDTRPTIQRVEWAKNQILVELLGDFPFKDDASRAHAVALTLLPFVRHFITGATPLHLADAPTPGTGKGLFISACCFPALGEEVPSMPAKTDDNEWRKAITALLEKGSSHTNIDNIAGKLESASLSAALTQGIWEDRQLGATHMLRLPIRTIWTGTANNVQPDGDIARRCLWIRLDSNLERPQDRTDFRHDDLLSWAKAERSNLVTAAMILINNWVAKGEPAGSYIKGSYQVWAKTMGGILDAAGIEGFLGNERELADTAVNENQVWKAFIEAWADAHHEQWVAVKDLFPIASHYDPPATVQGLGLLDDLLGAGNERSRQSRLGRQLAKMADRVIDGWKVTRGSMVKGNQQWCIKRPIT